MKRFWIIFGIAVAVIAGGILLYNMSKNSDDLATNQPSTTDTQPTTTEPETTNSETGTKAETPAATQITIESNAFAPRELTVKKGTKVTWTNKDEVAHTVTMDEGQTGGPDSPSLGQNDTYEFTFDTAGTFNYHCTPHPNMKATVIVTE